MATTAQLKNQRIEMRASEDHKATIERAIALTGQSMSDFMLQAGLQHAEAVLAQQSTIKLRNDVFDNFMDACENFKEPNQALKEALSLTRESGIE